jgi:hypothetical protein
VTRAERDALLSQLRETDRKLFPGPTGQTLPKRERLRAQDDAHRIMGEYGDRLDRVRMGICPFTGGELKRSFDRFDLAGPWWWMDRPFDIDEPAPPPAFKVLLGAVNLNGRVPSEVADAVLPGPDVPFVVPNLLKLPGMVAVISELDLESGDRAYPISYWSPEEIPPDMLHQPWLRQEFWFDDGAAQSWIIANDQWDFDLAKWIAAGKVFWLPPGEAALVGTQSNRPCPYVDLKGDRLPQSLAGGERELLELPTGEIVNPFEEDDGKDDEDDDGED